MTLPRFSLRLLLVAVAVLCAWLAWERSVVMERRAFRAQWKDQADWGAKVSFHLIPADGLKHYHDAPAKAPTVSLVRHALGDEAVQELWVWFGTPESQVARARALFPEASIARFPSFKRDAPAPLDQAPLPPTFPAR